MEIRELIGKNVKSERERAGLTQRELADRLGWNHPQSVSNAERGDRSWTVEDLISVAVALHRPVQDFLAGVPGVETASRSSEEIAADIERLTQDLRVQVGLETKVIRGGNER